MTGPARLLILGLVTMFGSRGLINCYSPFASLSQQALLEKLANGGKNLEPNETRRILSSAAPATRIGRISVADLVKLDEIAIEHCNKKELDARYDTCKRSLAGENARRFCEERLGRQIELCVRDLPKVFRANLVMIRDHNRRELDFFMNQLEMLLKDRTSEADVKAAIEEFMAENKVASESYKTQLGERCNVVTEHLDSIEAIMEYSGSHNVERRLNRSLLDSYKLYKYCKLFLEDHPVVE